MKCPGTPRGSGVFPLLSWGLDTPAAVSRLWCIYDHFRHSTVIRSVLERASCGDIDLMQVMRR